jgi:hypothetical protein
MKGTEVLDNQTASQSGTVSRVSPEDSWEPAARHYRPIDSWAAASSPTASSDQTDRNEGSAQRPVELS